MKRQKGNFDVFVVNSFDLKPGYRELKVGSATWVGCRMDIDEIPQSRDFALLFYEIVDQSEFDDNLTLIFILQHRFVRTLFYYLYANFRQLPKSSSIHFAEVLYHNHRHQFIFTHCIPMLVLFTMKMLL